MPKSKAAKKATASARDGKTYRHSEDQQPESLRSKEPEKRAKRKNPEPYGDEKATVPCKNRKTSRKLEDHKTAYKDEEKDRKEAVLAAKAAKNDEEIN